MKKLNWSALDNVSKCSHANTELGVVLTVCEKSPRHFIAKCADVTCTGGLPDLHAAQNFAIGMYRTMLRNELADYMAAWKKECIGKNLFGADHPLDSLR